MAKTQSVIIESVDPSLQEISRNFKNIPIRAPRVKTGLSTGILQGLVQDPAGAKNGRPPPHDVGCGDHDLGKSQKLNAEAGKPKKGTWISIGKTI
jgi:hypothetical protein